ncbi:MAG TPA: GNAT family N-acetyltransferase [Bacteroidia bacterium]|nr:GNAT family N-acetyltransferase [Bacteroidia bacterium]
MEIQCKAFEALSLYELHAIYRLRSEVFVLEQNCAYQDVDDLDLKALHVFFIQNHKLIAYARVLAPGLVYPEPAIGRVVVEKGERNKGIARKLMAYCMRKSLSLFPAKDIRISAQAYLEDFYRSLGFKAEGKTYLEDGIPHLSMRFNHLNNSATFDPL